jgi:hypothetical protein
MAFPGPFPRPFGAEQTTPLTYALFAATVEVECRLGAAGNEARPAERGKRVRHILLVVTVALVMAAMMVTSALPAFAGSQGIGSTQPCVKVPLDPHKPGAKFRSGPLGGCAVNTPSA